MDIQFLRKYTKQYIDKNGNTLLHKAVKEGNHVLLHKAALMETSVNKQNKDGYSALHYAVKHGDCAMVERVLQCGVNPLLKTKLGETAKDIAIRNKNCEVVTLLEIYGGGLECAIMNKDTKETIVLLNNWVNLNNVWRSAMVPDTRELFKENLKSMSLEYYRLQNHFLHLIAADEYEEVSIILNEKGQQSTVNINSIHASNSSTPLSLAIQNGNIKMVNLLLDFGANSSIRLSDGTPLTHYSWNIKAPFQIILSLLKDQKTWHMRSPVNGLAILMNLVKDPSISGVHIHKLLEVTECAILIDRDSEGRDIQEFCILHNRPDLIDSIHESIAELLSNRNGKLRLISLAVALLGQTVLNVPNEIFQRVYDCERSQSMFEIYEKFMEKISSLEVESNELFDAVKRGDIAAVKRHNVADFINKLGRTALHEAIINDKYDIALWLLAERPGLRTIGDLNNRYPLHYAYAVMGHYGKKYVHLFMENDGDEGLEKLTDMNNDIPSALNINSKLLSKSNYNKIEYETDS